MRTLTSRTITKNEIIVADILCNKCGKSLVGMNVEGLVADLHGGYESKIGDGSQVHFAICETCLIELFKTFKIPETYGEIEEQEILKDGIEVIIQSKDYDGSPIELNWLVFRGLREVLVKEYNNEQIGTLYPEVLNTDSDCSKMVWKWIINNKTGFNEVYEIAKLQIEEEAKKSGYKI